MTEAAVDLAHHGFTQTDQSAPRVELLRLKASGSGSSSSQRVRIVLIT